MWKLIKLKKLIKLFHINNKYIITFNNQNTVTTVFRALVSIKNKMDHYIISLIGVSVSDVVRTINWGQDLFLLAVIVKRFHFIEFIFILQDGDDFGNVHLCSLSEVLEIYYQLFKNEMEISSTETKSVSVISTHTSLSDHQSDIFVLCLCL